MFRLSTCSGTLNKNAQFASIITVSKTAIIMSSITLLPGMLDAYVADIITNAKATVFTANVFLIFK